jgi:predicted RNase H-like HicB family nuclease
MKAREVDVLRGEREGSMPKVTMVYWKGERFWLGKLLEHPEIMSQGETLEDLEAHLKDAYRLLVLEDVPTDAQVKELAL